MTTARTVRLCFTCEGSIPSSVVAALIGVWIDEAAEPTARVLAELGAPHLPPHAIGIEQAANRVELWHEGDRAVCFEWQENDPQEKVGLYHYGFLEIARGHDRLTVWLADHAGETQLGSAVPMWLTLADGATWRAERTRLARALAPHGLCDDSDPYLVGEVMRDGIGLAALLAALPQRHVLAEDACGTWIGAAAMNADPIFRALEPTAWLESGGRFVPGSWIPDRWTFRRALGDPPEDDPRHPGLAATLAELLRSASPGARAALAAHFAR